MTVTETLASPADAMALGRLANGQRSCRAFRPQPVPRAVLAALAAFPDFGRSHFGMASDWRIVRGSPLGFADPDHPANDFRAGRCGIEDIVDWRGE
ncbi:nitroreductase family protein [Sphingomonas sp. YL-JM2C]